MAALLFESIISRQNQEVQTENTNIISYLL